MKELNKAIAEGLGWTNLKWKGRFWMGFKPKTGKYTLIPNFKKLDVCIDHIVPVLNEMGWEVSFEHEDLYATRMDTRGCICVEYEEGSIPSQKMAYALWQVFLEVKANPPEGE